MFRFVSIIADFYVGIIRITGVFLNTVFVDIAIIVCYDSNFSFCKTCNIKITLKTQSTYIQYLYTVVFGPVVRYGLVEFLKKNVFCGTFYKNRLP